MLNPLAVDPPVSDRPTMSLTFPSISTYAAMALGERPRGRILFPGRLYMPESTVGYVRSTARAQIAEAHASPFFAPTNRLPWRDYPADALTNAGALIAPPFERWMVIISARNILNEWGYQLRLNNRWWRRYGDAPIASSWPVLQFTDAGMQLAMLREAPNDADLVTGVPLVIDGAPAQREYLVTFCSDVAHTFDVDPRGRRGPSVDAWHRLSNLWQQCKDEALDELSFAARMEAEAKLLGVTHSRHLLHSIMAQSGDGLLFAVAINGALAEIATELVRRWDARHAILLDNSGSVAWQLLAPGDEAPKILISAPNYRPNGTVFIACDLTDYPHGQGHPALGS